MPDLTFLPSQQKVDVQADAKILAAARRSKIEIRFGCASCRCGTCAVKILEGQKNMNAMKDNEQALLNQMGLPIDGSVRLACQARIQAGDATVDIGFQDQYCPDSGLDPA